MSNKLRKLLYISSVCMVVCYGANAADNNTDMNAIQSKLETLKKSAVKKEFNYEAALKGYSDSVKKEVIAHYKKTDESYNSLSEMALEAVRKVNKQKRKFFSKKK